MVVQVEQVLAIAAAGAIASCMTGCDDDGSFGPDVKVRAATGPAWSPGALRGGASGNNASEQCRYISQSRSHSGTMQARFDWWTEKCECRIDGAFPFCWSQEDVDNKAKCDEAGPLFSWDYKSYQCVCTYEPAQVWPNPSSNPEAPKCPTEKEACLSNPSQVWNGDESTGTCGCRYSGDLGKCLTGQQDCVARDENSAHDEDKDECWCPHGEDPTSGRCLKAAKERCAELSFTTWDPVAEQCTCTHLATAPLAKCPTKEEVCRGDAWATWDASADECTCRFGGAPGSCLSGDEHCVAQAEHSEWDAAEEGCVCAHDEDAPFPECPSAPDVCARDDFAVWDEVASECACIYGGAPGSCTTGATYCVKEDPYSTWDAAKEVCTCKHDEAGTFKQCPSPKAVCDKHAWAHLSTLEEDAEGNAVTQTCTCTHDAKAGLGNCPSAEEVCARDAWAVWSEELSACTCKLDGTPGACVSGEAYCTALDADAAWDAASEQCLFPDDDEDDGLPTWAVVAAAAGGVLALAAVIACIARCLKK